ncbi:MAG: hypothetical protein ACR2NJ_01465 [Acidimicrobiales bacterium]
MIEILTFHLRPGVEEPAFLATDKAVQADFAYQQPGLLRRTTAKGEDGNWVVIDLWSSAEAADSADQRWGTDPATARFSSMLDRGTVTSARYHELG